MPSKVTYNDILEAQRRLSGILPVTPLTHSPTISELSGIDVYFKWENKFKTGSFKERGAVNVLASLNAAARKKGVCAASAGNHALALSYHAARFKIPCHIVMPLHAPLVKIQSTQKTGAEVILHGETFDQSYQFAKELAAKYKYTFVSPFDDPLVVAGQGTAGLEISKQAENLDSIIVPVGGGGLIAGIALALSENHRGVYVLGVQSEWVRDHAKPSAAQKKSLLGSVSIADGIAVKTLGAITSVLIERHVDKLVSLAETEIAKAIIKFLETERVVVEGAAAVGLGSLLNGQLPKTKKRCVIVVSGSNIDVNVLSRLIEWDMGERDRTMRINISVPDRPGSLYAATGIIAGLGANVLEVFHDRSFSLLPGNVDITFLLEVKDRGHKDLVIQGLREKNIEVREF